MFVASPTSTETASRIWCGATFSTGENAVWLMDGLTIASSYFLTTVGDLNWHLEAVADLSNDGIPDLIWRNYGTGENVAWYLDQNGRYSGNPGTFDYLPSVPVGAGWKLGGRAEDVDGVPNPVHRK